MTRNKKLLVLGCSHSAGSEISHKDSHRTTKDLKRCFGGIIARRNNIEMINAAIPGSSNDVIISNAILQINNILNDGTNTKDLIAKNLIVLLGWTSDSRSQAVYDNKLWSWTINSGNAPGWKKYAPSPIRKHFDSWCKMYDMDTGSNKFIMQYQLFKAFLDSKNIKYYFFNAIGGVREPKQNLFNHLGDGKIDNIGYELMKHDPCYRKPFAVEHSYFHYLKETVGLDPRYEDRWHHYGVKGHLAWADIIEQDMKNLKLL